MATIYTAREIETLREAAQEGEAYAKSLKVGDHFFGVRPEAQDRFPEDQLAQGVFMTIALRHLPKLTVGPDAHVIVALVPKS